MSCRCAADARLSLVLLYVFPDDATRPLPPQPPLDRAAPVSASAIFFPFLCPLSTSVTTAEHVYRLQSSGTAPADANKNRIRRSCGLNLSRSMAGSVIAVASRGQSSCHSTIYITMEHATERRYAEATCTATSSASGGPKIATACSVITAISPGPGTGGDARMKAGGNQTRRWAWTSRSLRTYAQRCHRKVR
jgi:hypothetical protein